MLKISYLTPAMFKRCIGIIALNVLCLLVKCLYPFYWIRLQFRKNRI